MDFVRNSYPAKTAMNSLIMWVVKVGILKLSSTGIRTSSKSSKRIVIVHVMIVCGQPGDQSLTKI